jgi:hypothetical protein
MTGVTDEQLTQIAADYGLDQTHEGDDLVAEVRRLLALRTALRDAKPALETGARLCKEAADRSREPSTSFYDHHASTIRALVGRIEG